MTIACPDCKEDMRGGLWDTQKGGECPHCHGYVESNELEDHDQVEMVRWSHSIRTDRDIVREANLIRKRKLRARRVERLNKLETIARGNVDLGIQEKFPVVYADPPWRYEHVVTESRAIENQYPTMSLNDICALPVGRTITDDAILFLWATSPKLEEAMRVVKSWSFEYRTNIVWDKCKIGMGYYARQQHELLLIATRGSMPAPAPDDIISSVVRIPRNGHSSKPLEFYNLIERMYPSLPKLELFCRSPQSGWSVWGNQSNS
jgi:N6-adenosine-specific RNA methylase IME4